MPRAQRRHGHRWLSKGCYNPCPLLPSRSLFLPQPRGGCGAYPVQTPGFQPRGPSLAAGSGSSQEVAVACSGPVPAVSHGPEALGEPQVGGGAGAGAAAGQARAAGRGAGGRRGWTSCWTCRRRGLSARCSCGTRWNPEDRPLNVFVKDDDRAHLPPAPGWRRARMASAARWATLRGLHALADPLACTAAGHARGGGRGHSTGPLHSVGYTALVGSDAESWGWDLGPQPPLPRWQEPARRGLAPHSWGLRRPLRCPTHCSWC